MLLFPSYWLMLCGGTGGVAAPLQQPCIDGAKPPRCTYGLPDLQAYELKVILHCIKAQKRVYVYMKGAMAEVWSKMTRRPNMRSRSTIGSIH
jgi:hypothetical protein